LLALVVFAFGLLILLASLWQIVLFVLTLAEVHRFSIWRSLATWFLFGLAVFGPLFCLLVLSSVWSVGL